MEDCWTVVLYKALVDGVCGYNTKEGKRKNELVPLLSCNKDINNEA